jgi:putative colanic acid biosynthesis glycosyltransferase
LKILFINVVCNTGSTGKIVYDLYEGLLRTGHTAHICYGRGARSEDKALIKTGSQVGMYLDAFLTRLTGVIGYFSLFSTFRILREIKRYQPDILHMHEPKTYYLNIGWLVRYLKNHKIKTVWTLHSEFLYTGKCGHPYDCRRWKEGCGSCPQLKEYPKSLFRDCTAKMLRDKKRWFADFNDLTVVAVSNWLAARAKQTFLADKCITVAYNGIDTKNIFYPRDCQKLKIKHHTEGKKIVLSVAPELMSERKGGKWAVELAREMECCKNVLFILIGVDDLSFEHGNNVILLNRTKNQSELAEYYTLADVTLLTSKMETFSMVCAESLACGTPVVGFEAGAPSEIIPEGYGYFAPYGDIAKLKSNLKAALFAPSELKVPAECVAFCNANYSREAMLDRYLKIYGEILGE